MNSFLSRLLPRLFGLTMLLAAPSAFAEILTRAEVAELVQTARLDLAASAGHGMTGESLEAARVRALTETDPARREVMISVWLREWVGPEPFVEPRPADLQRLVEFSPIVRVVHHEHPGRSMPAFNVAAHARNRLDEQTIRRVARALRDRPDAIRKALTSPAGSPAFLAGLRATVHASPDVRGSLADLFASKRAGDADASTLAFVDHGLIGQDALLDVIEFAPPATALQAVRRIDDLDVELRTPAIDAALDRPELGGLPVALAARHGGAVVNERLWTLLDDPGRGADAALALAQERKDLAEQIDQRFDFATPRARLRMLLALSLQDSPDSRTLLAELRKQRLSASEQRAAEAWR